MGVKEKGATENASRNVASKMWEESLTPGPQVEHEPGYAFLVAGGSLDESDIAYARSSAFVVAVDSGAMFLKEHDLIPDVIVGDFDSLDAETLRYFKSLEKPLRAEKFSSKDAGCLYDCLHTTSPGATGNVEIVSLPRDKDKTDTEVGLDIVLDRGFSTAVLVGGCGGTRIDHEIANLFLIERYAKMDLDVILCSKRTMIFGLSGADSEYSTHKSKRWFRGKPGDWVTIIPITPEVEGVTTYCLRFPLYDAILERGATLGVSNEMTQNEAAVSVAKGFCLVIVTAK